MEAPGDNEPVGSSPALLETTESSPDLEVVECSEEKDWDKELARYSQSRQSLGKRAREDEEIEETKEPKMAAVPFKDNNIKVSDDGEDDDDDVEDDNNDDSINEDEGDSDDVASNEDGKNKVSNSSNTQKNKKKKKRKARKKRKKPRTPKHQRLANELKGKAAKLIEGLSIHLTKHTSSKVSRSTMGIYQSKSFQLAAQHLITKDPVDQSSFCDISSVSRVMFVWLSCVSAEMYLRDSSAFVNLSKLPSYPFLIMHPGSETYCEYGSDAFLTIKTDRDVDMKLKRSKCILSPDLLKENDYPIKCGCHGNKNLDQLASNLEVEEGELQASADTDYWCLCSGTDFPEVTDESPLFAIDCEMVSTVEDDLIGDVARVSVIDEQGECVYDTFVKPYTVVLDYRTRYSGISEELLDGVTTTLADVQQKLKQIIPADAILVGQSLENDLRSLKLFHPYVIDTSLLFTNNSKYKPKLRVLAHSLLKSTIQTSDKGHSSVEDALTCMKLVQLKLKKGCTVVKPYSGHVTNTTPSVGLFQVLASRGKSCAFVDRHASVLDYSQGNIHSIVAETDIEATRCAQSAIKSSDVVWLKLCGMQDYLTQPGTVLADARLKENLLHQEAIRIHTDSDNQISLAASKEGASKKELADIKNESRLKAIQCLQQSVQVYQDAYKQEAANINKIIRQLDSHVYDLICACPKDTLVFVTCGSSHVDRIPPLFKASKHCPSDQVIQTELRRVVQEAREGLVLAHFVMHD